MLKGIMNGQKYTENRQFLASEMVMWKLPWRHIKLHINLEQPTKLECEHNLSFCTFTSLVCSEMVSPMMSCWPILGRCRAVDLD